MSNVTKNRSSRMRCKRVDYERTMLVRVIDCLIYCNDIMHTQVHVVRRDAIKKSSRPWGGAIIVQTSPSDDRRVDPKIFFCLNDAARRSIPQHKVRIT